MKKTLLTLALLISANALAGDKFSKVRLFNVGAGGDHSFTKIYRDDGTVARYEVTSIFCNPCKGLNKEERKNIDPQYCTEQRWDDGTPAHYKTIQIGKNESVTVGDTLYICTDSRLSDLVPSYDKGKL